MNYVGQLAESVFATVKELYQDLNPATLSGCIDVVVVRQPDNSFKCSPFHVRFGKLGVLRSKEKVVDIEINGKPVDLHMKLGNNGEAFFVEELEEHEGSIPCFLCTSPIFKKRCPEDAVQPSCGLEASSTGVILHKRRPRKRRPKKKEVLDSDSDSCDETKSELPAPSDAAHSSFADLLEVTGSLQPSEKYSYSDGEVFKVDSFMSSHRSSSKSDSELEIKPRESFSLAAESHMKWTWGRLPQVNKLVQVKPTKSTKITAAAATTISATLVPVDEATPLVATSEHLGGDSNPAEPQGHSLAVSSTEPTLTPPAGNSISRLKNILRAVRTKRFLGAYSVSQEKQKGDVNVVPEVQPDVEPFEGATAPRQAGSEGPTSQLERQRRQGSIKRSPHLDPSAIYLEDFSELDKKPVALYLAGSDTEQSLRLVTDPSNPLCIQLPSTLPANSAMDSDSMPTVALSLCGGLRGNRQVSHEKFMEHMVSYQQFAENPRLISDPNLVIMINKKYYNWAVAGPIVLALQAFQRNIPESIIDELVEEKMPKKEWRNWFSWRRREFSTEGNTAPYQPLKKINQNQHTPLCLQQQPRPGKASVGTLWHDPAQQRWEEKESPSDHEPQHPGDMSAVKAPTHKPLPTFKKSLRLSSKQIGRLNLQDGPNEVAFSVTTQYQGTCRCEATIYLWNWNEKVVISDIDGTITKSDALGHILPQLGKDWTHRGIVKLFHKIHLNGYKFLYCSARAIGMAHITKGYLKWVNEQGCGLPMGPMLLSPSSLLSAFHREVIEKKPEVFKVTCLTDIRKLFTTKYPFYAGFGNRPNDVYAYKQVGLPESRIFTVNPKGELTQELSKNQKSTYERLSELVEVFFPPVGQRGSTALVPPEYSHFAYGRPPLPDVDLDVLP
ncbi:phosphatidate phosphatase LPIN3 isoform X2 [Vidua chalybeata]|nr:phosphatidate phosphatase LPIN3 isoform X2 [Vidua chalybeata]XP_053814777.1 phosphatidate phosphatase LPIN3 isoform X2 [Vidua chalybeata]XP_053814778.1 phosphatidate phosphatase LPIN3 isoform X2 [Vidua chalybeata]XP_053814779.1 phosphatidate phosphatase LPIN3 isoform X2 [Vidua chalybeata]